MTNPDRSSRMTSRILAVLILAGLWVVFTQHRDTLLLAVGKEQFLADQSKQFDLRQIHHGPRMLVLGVLVALFFGVYELLAFGLFKLISKFTSRA